MRRVTVLALAQADAGCSTQPCVDGKRTSSGGSWSYSARVADDPCPQECCDPSWTRGCACRNRCPCVARHPK